MGDVINLRQARKTSARAQKMRVAQSNRVIFGRTKAERAAAAAEKTRTAKIVEGARRETQEDGD